MKKKTMVAVIVVALAAIAAVVLFRALSAGDGDRKAPPAEPSTVKEGVSTPGTGTGAVERVTKRGPRPQKRRDLGTNDVSRVQRKKMPRLPVEDPYTPEERRLADNLQDASDDNDIGKVRRAVAEIMSQKNPELKSEAVSALGFFGKDALTDLMAFLRDPSQEVVDSAASAISSALDELEEEENGFKAEFISTLLSVDGLCGQDAADVFVSQLENLGSSDEKLAVQTMANMIEDGKVGNGVKTRLKEAYEFITGEAYTTFDAAETWYKQKVAEEQSESSEEAGESGEGDDDKESGGDDDDRESGEDTKNAES